MALCAVIIAYLTEIVRWLYIGENPSATCKVDLIAFAKPAFTCTLASPLGYASLKYISFPLMILAKSSKPGNSSLFI